jgi:hypothetical protein
MKTEGPNSWSTEERFSSGILFHSNDGFANNPLCLAHASSTMRGATETERKLVYMIGCFDDDAIC